MKPVAVGLLALATTICISPCAAQTPEQFYKGKQIELAIGYPPAGSNDIYARLLGRHLGKHIPGNPTIVPQNRPGAGSFRSEERRVGKEGRSRWSAHTAM